MFSLDLKQRCREGLSPCAVVGGEPESSQSVRHVLEAGTATRSGRFDLRFIPDPGAHRESQVERKVTGDPGINATFASSLRGILKSAINHAGKGV